MTNYFEKCYRQDPPRNTGNMEDLEIRLHRPLNRLGARQLYRIIKSCGRAEILEQYHYYGKRQVLKLPDVT